MYQEDIPINNIMSNFIKLEDINVKSRSFRSRKNSKTNYTILNRIR